MLTPLHAWKEAAERGDATQAASSLAADAVLVSPLTDGFAFEGREEIEKLLSCVFTIFHDIRVTDEFAVDDQVVLFSEGTVRGRRLAECQRLELDQDGRIQRVMLMMRPLASVTAFVRALGPVLARAQGHPGRAAVLGASGAFLDAVATTGDRRFMPLAAPGQL